MPSASQKYCKKDYDLHKEFLNKVSIFNDLTTRFYELYHFNLFDFGREDKRTYYEPFTDLDSRPLWKEALQRVSHLGFCKTRDSRNYFSYLRTVDDFNEYCYVLVDEINTLALRVLDTPDYYTYLRNRDEFMIRRGESLAALYRDSEQCDISLLVEQKLRSVHRNDWKDTF